MTMMFGMGFMLERLPIGWGTDATYTYPHLERSYLELYRSLILELMMSMVFNTEW